MNKVRNDKLDYFKGILMLGVVIGHLITAFKAGDTSEVYIHTFLRAFDMPFFMLISGYFMAKSVDRYIPWRNALNKVSTILIPLAIWLSIFYVLRELVSYVVSEASFSIRGYLTYLTQASWFLWSAFICSVLMIAVCGIFKKQEIRFAVSIILSLGCLFIPEDMYNIAFMFPFFALGFFIDFVKEKIGEKAVNIIKTASVACFIVLICFWSMDYTVWSTGSYLLGGNFKATLMAVLFRFFIGATGCVTMSVVFDILYLSSNKVLAFINKNLVSVGKNTLMIYLFQGFVVEFVFARVMVKVVNIIGRNIFVSNTTLLGIIISPITAFICIVVLNFVINKLKKLPKVGKYIFGFKIISADRETVAKGNANE